MDRLTSIEIFVKAVEYGSFAAVANENNLSAQMVGKHIRGLEASLGTKLLNKSTRSQTLTMAGEHYYQRCKNVLAELHAAEVDVQRTINEPTGKLSLVSGVNFGISILAPIVAKFQNDYPKMSIDMCITNQPIDALKSGFDIIFSDQTIGFESFIAQKIRSYSMIACAAPSYLEKYGIPQHPKDLCHHQCLDSTPGQSGKHWRFIVGDAAYTPVISSRLAINSAQALRNAAIEGAGVTLQPGKEVVDTLKTGRLVQILQSFPVEPISMYMIYPPHLRNTAKLTAFKGYFEDEE